MFCRMFCRQTVVFLRYEDHDIDGLVQERHNSSALAMELRLSCTNPSNEDHKMIKDGVLNTVL